MITADQIIDRYVADVVTLLPRKQRRDVAQELRTLLTDEVDAAAGGRAGRRRIYPIRRRASCCTTGGGGPGPAKPT